MSRKKATLVTINSLTTLPKVRHSFESLNTLVFVNHLCTAAERSDFHCSNGYNSHENSLDNQHTISGYGENYGANVGYSKNSFVKNPNLDGYHVESTRNWVPQKEMSSQNHNGFYGAGARIEKNETLDEGNGNFGDRNYVGKKGSSSGYQGENRASQSSYDTYSNARETYQYNQKSGWRWGNEALHNGGSTGQTWSSQSNHYGGKGESCPTNFGNYGASNTGSHQQNLGYLHAGNSAAYQYIASDYQARNVGMYQHNHGNHCTGNVGLDQQGHAGGITSSSKGYYPEALSANQGNPSGNYNRSSMPYQHNFVVSQNNALPSQASNGVTFENQSGDATEGSPNHGTLDELDKFCEVGKIKEAVEVMQSLETQCITIDLTRYAVLMKACGEAKALEEAKSVHEHLIRSISPIKVSIFNKILEMYAKCGSMDDAYNVFNKMPERNLTSWDTMITWLARNGLGEEAIDMFTRFKKAGLKPDGEMFIGVFAACGVIGDVTEGMLHFELMAKVYSIVPSMRHYAAIVDMFGNCGYLEEALEFIEKIPMEPSVDIWETLMNLSRVHGNLELGDRCAEIVEQLDQSRLTKESKAGLIPVNASDLVKEKEKKAKQNLLEVKSRVHEYRAGDRSHPENDRIYALLKGLKETMKEAGYLPETRFVLHDVDQESKEEAIMAHSERLATAYGLISSPARAPIRIIKNLRVCVDCHNALKIISKLVGREIIMRDAKRFHHLKDGRCSCNDYW